MRSAIAKTALFLIGSTLINSASAAIQFSSRYTAFDITVSDPQFSSASVHYSTTFGVTGDPGDTLNGYAPLKSQAINGSVTADGGISVSNFVVSPGVSLTATLTSDGTDGTTTISYDTPVANLISQSFLIRGMQNGLPVLNFFGGDGLQVFTLMAPGSRYDLDVTINGDWTHWGSDPGDILGTSLNFGGGWTFDQPFSFDGNKTLIRFHNSSYDGSNGPGLGFTLFGSAATVPEPGSIALVGLGLTALVTSRRRSKR